MACPWQQGEPGWFKSKTGGTLKRLIFAKKKRLVGNRQFKAVLDRRLRVSDGLLTLFMAENDCGYPRLGISVAKSCGGAVVRNRWKRLLRESFRQSQDRIPAGFDYLLMISREWSKELNSAPEAKEALKRLMLEQVKTSFLALVAAAVYKIKKDAGAADGE
jgi:ribonuclease P protein component